MDRGDHLLGESPFIRGIILDSVKLSGKEVLPQKGVLAKELLSIGGWGVAICLFFPRGPLYWKESVRGGRDFVRKTKSGNLFPSYPYLGEDLRLRGRGRELGKCYAVSGPLS